MKGRLLVLSGMVDIKVMIRLTSWGSIKKRRSAIWIWSAKPAFGLAYAYVQIWCRTCTYILRIPARVRGSGICRHHGQSEASVARCSVSSMDLASKAGWSFFGVRDYGSLSMDHLVLCMTAACTYSLFSMVSSWAVLYCVSDTPFSVFRLLCGGYLEVVWAFS